MSLSEGGSEAGDLHLYETASGRKLADVIPRVNGGTAGGDVAWNADGSGFFYTRYPRGDERLPRDRDFYQQVYFHRIGTPTEQDAYAVGQRLSPHRGDHARVLPGRKRRAGLGQERRWRTRSRSICEAPTEHWKLLASDVDRAIEGKFGPDGSLYLLSRKGAPRGRILRLPPGASSLTEAREIVPAGEHAIDDFCLSGDRLFVADLAGGPSQIRVFGRGRVPEGIGWDPPGLRR